MNSITDINVIQTKLNVLLNKFADICEKHELQFYLANGTLLGAVKYQGFIPWDDDIDILMPREDYEKLMTLEEIENDSYALYSMERYETWKLPFSKFCDKETVLQETTADFGCEIGCFLDIFPMDYWNDCKLLAKIEASFCGLYRRFISASLEKNFYTPRTDWRRLILYLIWLFSRFIGTDFFLQLVINKRTSRLNSQKKYMGAVVWAAYGKSEVLETEKYEPAGTVIFEGRQYPVFSGWDEYLTQHYGEYREELPPEKQKTHHTFIIYEK